MSIDRNCLSYWFPILERAGLPVPRTRIIRATGDLTPLLDGDPVALPAFEALCRAIASAAHEMGGYPVFLRTGHGSGKHNWRDTCHVPEAAVIGQHVGALVEWSALVDLMGLPTEVWAVREMLPTIAVGTAYHGMPVCREIRCFVTDGEVRCTHPYWPPESLAQGRCVLDLASFARLYTFDEREAQTVRDLASEAGHALGGSWSIDVLDTRRGWFITDVAEAGRSYHWPGCEAAKAEARS